MCHHHPFRHQHVRERHSAQPGSRTFVKEAASSGLGLNQQPQQQQQQQQQQQCSMDDELEEESWL
jgi:hypothetical protein